MPIKEQDKTITHLNNTQTIYNSPNKMRQEIKFLRHVNILARSPFSYHANESMSVKKSLIDQFKVVLNASNSTRMYTYPIV